MTVEFDKGISFEHVSCTDFFNEIPIVDSNISYGEFFQKFLMNNQPCVIRNVSSNWECTKRWIREDFPDFMYLESYYGDSCVNVQDCNAVVDYHNAKCEIWKFRDYLSYWENCIKWGYPKNKSLYYLKDWHMKNEYPGDKFYEVPLQFASDWLNEYLVDKNKDDYRFVYMGVKGTWSPFHVDVMTSFSWSSNINGQKRWVLFPPGQETSLCDHLGNLPHDISSLLSSGKSLEVIQNPGDAIFVPSNWHHQVWNLKDTISVNHNWINGCNLKNIWQTMERNLEDIKKEIQDCEDMEDFLEHCQVMLSVSFGMAFNQFYDFISHIAFKRINVIDTETSLKLPENRILGRNHAIFDLQSIEHTLSLLCEHTDIKKLNYFQNDYRKPYNLLKKIKAILSKV